MKFGVSSYIWVSPFSNDTIDQLKHARILDLISTKSGWRIRHPLTRSL